MARSPASRPAVAWPSAPGALPAQIPRIRATMTLISPTSTGAPVHDSLRRSPDANRGFVTDRDSSTVARHTISVRSVRLWRGAFGLLRQCIKVDRVVRWWAAVWLRAAGARVVVDGLEHVEPAATYVVVSNHQSNLDPMAHLRALPLSLRVLAKREMFQIWLLGPAMRAIGMIEVDRDSPDLGRIDQAAARALAAGHSLLVYPEGTTSPDGTIGEFKDGAFIIAVTSQVPVLPVAIDGTRRIWPPGRSAIHGGQVRIVVGSPLPTSGLAHHDIPRLREQARDVICSARRALDTAML